MKIYRVENNLGEGIFQCPPRVKDAALLDRFVQWRWEFIKDNHPAPFADGLWLFTDIDNYLFGCPGEFMFYHWFQPIADIITELGLRVALYENVPVEHYRMGKSGTQVIFNTKAVLPRFLSQKEINDIIAGK